MNITAKLLYKNLPQHLYSSKALFTNNLNTRHIFHISRLYSYSKPLLDSKSSVYSKPEPKSTNIEEAQVVLSPTAIKRLEELSNSSGTTQYLRVLVESGGCYGFQYKMDLTSEPQNDDIQGNAKMVIDKLSLELVRGATIDWVDELIGHSFKIVANPNSSGGCGCGASFEINI
ncbi:hypothetical protein BB561_004370 [Smittium simulii]|uniref:Core domain-containing protein n=1 Tax=Smittium simulii TaxID=133385 RepID=A0A2T9YGN7_9FUNG|nr:hypothetical protein BB561_004370 [Smittium simulii]